MARFDWYQASVTAEIGPLQRSLESLAHGTRSQCRWAELAKAPNGYGSMLRLEDMDGTVASVMFGGMHKRPLVMGTSECAPHVARLLRDAWPGHTVSRADVCIDYDEPGAYDRLQELALGIARDRGITVGTAGDHLVTMKGRTVYLGAKSSHTRLRIYDKAEELRAKCRNEPAMLAELPDELARLEVQVRPHTPEAKAAAALVEPMELMGSTAWVRELMRQVSGLELEPFEARRAWRQSDDDRAYASFLAQYGAMLTRRAGDHGSWEMFGRQIGDDLKERARLKLRR